ncbi:hypothetical protein GGR57DRAFT_49364 [Xylariaceae sp. FL1272]|nr:hypothetical protein GGR57DRAFT_49364 [Xylariaceae sp. FL1272]
MRRNATRWLGYVSAFSHALRPITHHDGFLARAAFSRASHPASHCCSPRRGLSSSARLGNGNRTPTPGPRSSSKIKIPDEILNKEPLDPKPYLYILAFFLPFTLAYEYFEKKPDDVIEQNKFCAFTVVAREQVSPSAFVITLRPSSVDGREEGEGWVSKSVREAWEHGLWSVEIKQPQLQIARHYTPLPPMHTEGGRKGEADLRILIRKMDGGEMSSYLSRQQVGDSIWLRGPWLGFDVPRRLGIKDEDGVHEREDRERDVVFLAGGTGVAPALQIAHKLLDDTKTEEMKSMPRVRILWANRHAADALGREKQSSTTWFGTGATKTNLDPEQHSALANQIRDLKRRHGEKFNIEYFVDAEGKFIYATDVENACRAAPDASGSIDRSCTWHSRAAVRNLPDDKDSERAVSVCKCTSPGVNLLCVSGPDGFIQAYAGAKRWHQGNEMQGDVLGVIGRLLERKGMEDWLVLKL